MALLRRCVEFSLVHARNSGLGIPSLGARMALVDRTSKTSSSVVSALTSLEVRINLARINLAFGVSSFLCRWSRTLHQRRYMYMSKPPEPRTERLGTTRGPGGDYFPGVYPVLFESPKHSKRSRSRHALACTTKGPATRMRRNTGETQRGKAYINGPNSLCPRVLTWGAVAAPRSLSAPPAGVGR